MLEEKWWNPKSFEQLEKAERERQFKAWVKQKCIDVIAYVTDEKCTFVKNRESNGNMLIECKTKENFESCCFYTTYEIKIDDFLDKDNPSDMSISKDEKM